MAERNYYDILGVDKNASDDEIKKSYRKLSMQWHPDRHATDTEDKKKEAEEKFKEISEAYTCLSDPDKRKQYDMGGQNPFGEGGFDMGDFMRHFTGGFGGFGGFGRNQDVGEDIEVTVKITMKQAFNEESVEVQYERPVPCHYCNGTGSADGKTHECQHCNGTGMVTKVQQTPFGYSQVSSPCPHCHGTGKDAGVNKCSHCGGTGFDKETVKRTIRIPKAAVLGMPIQISGEGGRCRTKNGVNGNLIVRFLVAASDGFYMEDGTLNIRRDVAVSLSDLLLGTKRTIECLDGKTVTIDISQCTAPGREYTFTGKGIPHPQDPRYTGDLIIKAVPQMPSKLSKEQENKIKELKNLGL